MRKPITEKPASMFIKVSKEQRRRLRMLAAKRDCTLTDLLSEAIMDLLKKDKS